MHSIQIRSNIKNYTIDFVDDFIPLLRQYASENDFFLVDDNVNKLYAKRLRNIIPEKYLLTVSAEEKNKTLDYCQRLIQILVDKDIRKDSRLIAVGGGITQDIAAFISTIIFRGIDWIFFPTTLLAQADSCIGSKSSVNFKTYKNLLGSFWPPSSIYIDLHFIATLSPEAIKSGIGEMLHFFLFAGDKLAERLADEYERLLESPELLKEYVFASLNIKKKVIETDEFDKKERNLFNYGHTFGHAIEAATAYAINHGQAVTIGMDIANYISFRLGYMNEDTLIYMHRLLSKNIPHFQIEENMINDYFKALSKDKKNIGSKLGCILTKGPGSMEKAYLTIDGRLKDIIMGYFRWRVKHDSKTKSACNVTM